MPLKRIGTESEVSAAIVFLLSPAAAFISGITLQIDGGSLGGRAWPIHKASQQRSFDGFHRADLPDVLKDKEYAMPVIQSQLDPHSEPFARNRAAMLSGIEQVRKLEQNLLNEAPRPSPSSTSAASCCRASASPSCSIAARLPRAVDAGRLQLHDDDGSAAGGGLIVGIGLVSGVRALVVANDSAIKGGTVSPMGLRKALRAQQIALENKLPLIYLVESGGANLMYQREMFVEGGRSFANQARLSAAGIPQIAVVHGSSTAGGAYLPGLSDYVVLVRGRPSIYLAGPPLVKAAIGEDVTDDELGGAQTHAEVTGLGEYLGENDAHAIAIARELVDKLQWDGSAATPTPLREPLYADRGTDGPVPDEREPYDVREVIARLVDGSDFLEFKPGFVGHGVRPSASTAAPAASSATTARSSPPAPTRRRSSSSCATRAGTPLVFLQNTTGYMVGSAAERGVDQARRQDDPGRGQRARAEVHLRDRRLVRRRQLRHVRPRLRPALHLQLAQRAHRGDGRRAGRQGDGDRHRGRKLGRAGARTRRRSAMLEQVTAQTLDRESSVLFGTARLWDDGIIDPRDTRRVLGCCWRSPRGRARHAARQHLRRRPLLRTIRGEQ